VLEVLRQDNEVVRLGLRINDNAELVLYFKHATRPFAGSREIVSVREVLFIRSIADGVYESSHMDQSLKEVKLVLHSTAWGARDHPLGAGSSRKNIGPK
jgi:hypothetical protein